ncbi:MAG: GIY-YIG nuclease family protein [Candidatus Thiodiazotropha sp. (ex. Lucinisca nassula)]|nr:GIY-YIG nuclease family protein [Candidatus Thiodiazotropha sp. (ex. Lucinisca nassula)]MBW9273069.1 GIY-YIG nuclease family protein [Candidatus Thiodiazotropha sp. (ex. Lucinisca nassula)]
MSFQQTTLPIQGASGTTYRFTVYPWGTQFQSFGAVYTVLRNNGGGRYSILYVGQTGDMEERFDDHHKQRCFDRNGKTHIGVLPEPNEQRRLAIESDLVNAYNPPCNG